MHKFMRLWVAIMFSVLPFVNSSAQEKFTLQQAVELALQQNPQLLLVEQEIAVAQGRVLQAGALPPTEIFSRISEISFDFSEKDEIEVGLRQSFEFPGKRSGRKAVAQADHQIVELRLVRFRILVANAVKKSYYKNLLVNENLATRQFAVELLQDLQQLLTDRYQSGAGSYIEVLRSGIELGRGRNELSESQQEKIAASTKLNLLLGRESDAPIQFSDSLVYVPLSLPVDSLFAEIMRQSNLYKALTIAVERQSRALRLAKLAGRPDFSLGVSFQRVAENPPFTAVRPEGETVTAFSIEAGISLPLFNRSGAKGEAQIARAKLTAVEIQFEYFKQQLQCNFKMALTAVTTTEQQVLEFRDVVLPEAQNALTASLSAYESGELTLTDLLDIHRTVRQVRSEKNQAIFKYLAARASLDAVGEIFELNLSQD